LSVEVDDSENFIKMAEKTPLYQNKTTSRCNSHHVVKYGTFFDGMGSGELNISDGAIELAIETLQNLT
jgi:hypothetical protein